MVEPSEASNTATAGIEMDAQEFNFDILNDYLASSGHTLLGVNKDLFYRELHTEETQKTLKLFAVEKGQKALILSMSRSENPEPEGEMLVEVRFSLTVKYLGNSTHTVAFLKRELYPQLDLMPSGANSVSNQLQIINLGFIGEDANLFELAATYVEYSFLPLFNSYKGGDESVKSASATGLDAVRKNLAQLKVHLVQCKQNLDIPEIELYFDPDLKAKAEEAQKQGKEISDSDFEDKMADTEFIGRLQRCVDQWYKDIRKVTTLDHEPQNGSALQEINFWLSLERSLTHIKQQKAKPEVRVTLEILHKARKIKDVIRFQHDTDFDAKLSKAIAFNNLMRDFPINQMLSATGLGAVAEAIKNIFTHLNKIRHQDAYPITRAIQLLEALSKDLNAQIMKILGNQNLMFIDYADLKVMRDEIKDVFEAWFGSLKGFRELVRTQMPRRGDRQGVQGWANIEKNVLKDRLDSVFLFRYQHHKLQKVIKETIGQEGSAESKNFEEMALKEINEAHALMININILDLTPQGDEQWEKARKAYDLKVDKVEGQITSTLRDKLEGAKNSNEMFKVFSMFNALFLRPRIRGAIQEYQNRLLAEVKKDIQKLKDKFLEEKNMEGQQIINKVRDFPKISNKIIWTKQIERKLELNIDRVQKVLGTQWQEHPEGRELKVLGDTFARHLTQVQQTLFDSWVKEMSEININAVREKPLFEIVRHMEKFDLALNFNEKLFHLFKESINLKRMGFRQIFSVTLRAQDMQYMYPIALSLQDSLRTFNYVNAKVSDRFSLLIAKLQSETQKQLLEGLNIQWRHEARVDRFSKQLTQIVLSFEDAVNSLIELTDQIEELLEELNNCEVNREKLQDIIKRIQKIIDEFSFQGFSNLPQYVAALDLRVQEILKKKLEEHIIKWRDEFVDFQENQTGSLVSSKTVLEVKLQNQAIVLSPPVAEARTYWFKKFHDQIELICGVKKISHSAYNQLVKETKQKKQDYACLLEVIDQGILESAYVTIENLFRDADEYAKTWRSYQALWDIDSLSVYDTIGDSIEKCHQLLNEIRAGRATFDTSEDQKYFGPIIIFYGSVKAKVNSKYDTIHREILNRFGSQLGTSMKDFKTLIQGARHQLEKLNVDASDDVTLFVTEIQEMKRKVHTWQRDLDHQKQGQKLLTIQRFQFPVDWLWIDNIDSEWSAFRQILTKKSKIMDEQIPQLQAKIMEEEIMVNQKIAQVEQEWKEKGPYQGTIPPRIAIDILNIIGTKVGKTKNDWVRICKAKELLDMELGDIKRMDSIEDELSGLKSVWQEVHKVWQPIDVMNESLFTAYQAKKVKDLVDEAKKALETFPNRMRQYQVFDETKQQLKKYSKTNEMMSDLKSEAMKPRHWKELMQKLRLKIPFPDLTLSHLWQADLVKNTKAVADIMGQARGEMILEDFLRSIKECWSKFELELTKYQNKCRLIKGWDDVFAQVDEHINTLGSMKMSPYYKIFEEEILPWDDKLQKMRLIFDSWVDVQRRYVYLEGIFFGSADIKSMLAAEFSKFKGIDNEFTSLMKKVAQKPIVLEVLAIQNLQPNLERFSEMLNKIQKALGDYLEKQRQNFARFYFVGDEDLLEIIGNSKEIRNVQRHFPKMFAGITSLSFEEDGDQLLGMSSKEGEHVPFASPVVISEDPTIYVWLQKIEKQMQLSLALQLEKGVSEMELLDKNEQKDEFNEWIKSFPCQIVLLAMQVAWSNRVEESLSKKGFTLPAIENDSKLSLEMLAELVLTPLKKDTRQKYEQIITDLVHQRDVVRHLMETKADSPTLFAWLYYMRFYWNPKEANPAEKLQIKMANAQFFYGFEYLGVGDKLVQTPLTDRCFLTLTQALHWRLGGSPFGPAGTGKTESVKSLGSQLGRFTLVFNCDETFDGFAMGRIFVGLCQVGAWGCFDEFNRLEERMLSAVSQQILIIQVGLKEHAKRIELLGRDIKLMPEMGIFITMNPTYAGRSNLPDNLKQLFRQVAMVQPNKELIARVMLYSQGFKTAERLSGKMVSLFELCLNQLSSQSHYDFGLRALKSVLVSSGNLKRAQKETQKENMSPEEISDWEQNILIKSLCDTLVPKLVAEDIPLLSSLLQGVFPGSSIIQLRDQKLAEQFDILKDKHNLVNSQKFLEKVLQVYQIQNIHHGIMMVGPTGCGKTAAWKILLEMMEKIDGTKGEAYVIDPKAISKDDLYGKLDSTTSEWTDGVFTQTLRKIIDNVRGESQRRHWIIFDGDVDPEWVENLNSVLDDNKLLTLPSGERLQIPPNVRIMFEVETLKYATLATVSRCGMVWFSEDTLDITMVYHHFLRRLQQDEYDSMGAANEDEEKAQESEEKQALNQVNPVLLEQRRVRKECVDAIRPLFDDGFVTRAIDYAATRPHVMEFTRIRCLESMFALVRKGITNVIEYNEKQDYPLSNEQMGNYMHKQVAVAVLWGMGGSMNLATRTEFGQKLGEFGSVPMPSAGNYPLIDFEVQIEDQEWHLWKDKVPFIDVDPTKVTQADLVITTVDTLRHQEVLCSWISEHRPFLLCGPPGSGKTMTLMATLKNLTDFEMIFINFSSSTLPDLILKTFIHYCEYKKTPKGLILRPHQLNKWLVVFCDEINLPDTDNYGTQQVITFLRQITEQNGFWRPQDKQWVTLERIQFVGACNPPTDAGRHPLSDRFLRHCPLILVDFPGPESLKQIYGTFNRAMLKKVPVLKSHADSLTDAMVGFYTESQKHFTADMQAHYIYSPRELTRWKYAINEAITAMEDVEDLVRLFVHEGLRLFEDRLVYQEEKDWCNQTIDNIAIECFRGVDHERALARPIHFTNFINKDYVSVKQDELKKVIEARLQTFYEEELNVPLVVFDSVIDHILRIDRVLRQPLGHLLLVGASGVGKTTLTKFVSWMNNLSVFQIKAGRNYSVLDFDDDLRSVMKRAGCKGEKICFIFDESNVLSTAFLERMNALLASGEVPGLFDGDDYTALINMCKDAANREGRITDTEDELYKNFIYNVQRNLHVVFTMNPANPDFSNRTASSPALFNRCVIDWFGEWSQEGLVQVAKEFTKTLDIPDDSFTVDVQADSPESDPKNDIVADLIVRMHGSVVDVNQKLAKQAKKYNFITPRDFLDFIRHFVDMLAEKKEELQEHQYHLSIGLDKLRDTEQQVKELQSQLSVYQADLIKKEQEANEKLQLMVKEQNEAEKRKEVSIKTSEQLKVKQEAIAERERVVHEDLGKAEPALIAAQESVSGIKKDHLVQLKNMLKPPELVQLAVSSCCVLLVNSNRPKMPDWKGDALALIRADGFIQQVMNFDKDSVKKQTKEFIRTNFLQKDNWNVDKIMRASQAAGPLAKWVSSLLEYAEIFDSITPLREELGALQQEAGEKQKEYEEMTAQIAQLEKTIDQYKAEYAVLISEVQRLKSEMSTVQVKVERSINLIQNLSSERIRWEETSTGFQEQMSCIIGDTITSAAFCTYIGFFDHFYRNFLKGEWKFFLEIVNIKFRKDLSFTEFLSKPTDRLKWQMQELPNDELCVENAIILKRFNRYPLVIDPSDQAIKFILSHYADKKIQKTSFNDDSFMKQLESSIRFGYPLLVQDVEHIDPVLNSVLNKEVHKAGGRILIRVGDQEIDFTDSFMLFMITRNPTASFTPDLCSRVTFINFTVTLSSLQSQSLNILLKNEREEVDKKRNDLLKLQGECKVKLRQLEDSLLDALNKSEGSILENDKLIQTLETLKKEAAEIGEEVAKSEDTMLEVEQVSNEYLPLATMISKIFFSLESVGQISFLYQYSLQHFMEYVFTVLRSNEDLAKIPKNQPQIRLQTLTRELFVYIFQKAQQGLQMEHKHLFAIRLAQIRLQSDAELEELFQILLKSTTILETTLSPNLFGGSLTATQMKELEELSKHDAFQSLVSDIEANHAEWDAWFESDQPEDQVPKTGERKSEIYNMLRDIIILKVLRPDRYQTKAQQFIAKAVGNLENQDIDLKVAVEKESNCKSPLLLVSAPGFDASYKVDELAKLLNKKYTAVAIGSPEAFELVDKAIKAAAKNGTWVLLKNVHLAPRWLVELEKTIYKLTLNPSFRLFLTMEINPKVPSTLLRASHVFVFEPPAGIKASLMRSYRQTITAQSSDRTPVERARLHFLVSWFNAVVQERLRYTPIGWSKVYEFNESDQTCSLRCVDEWIESMGKDRTNIDPDKIPWDALRTLISQSIFGGKIDNSFDQRILESLVSQFFRAESFNPDFQLNSIITLPDLKGHRQFHDWIKALPDVESPAWSGLPMNVEKLVKERLTQKTIDNFKLLQSTGEEIEEKKESSKKQDEDKAKWLVELQEKVEALLGSLPPPLTLLQRTAQSITNPLFRFLEREVTVSSQLLEMVRSDMNLLIELCKGERKSTNILKELARELHADLIPKRWRKYTVATVPVTIWVNDFIRRIQQLNTLAGSTDFGKNGIWFGGLLFPEAYLTATRQAVAQENGWSLEELQLRLDISSEPHPQGFVLKNFSIEGASYSSEEQHIKLSNQLISKMPSVRIRWVLIKENQEADQPEVLIPVYLNQTRANLLFSVHIPTRNTEEYVWYQRGIALISWSSD